MAISKKTPARKKPAAKPAAKKKPAAKRAVKAKAPAAPVVGAPIRERLTKSAIISNIASSRNLSRQDVVAVLDELENLIARSLRRRSAGEFVWPGLMKAVAVKVAARKARPGVNPFTGEKITIKARPASRSVRVRVLKKLKEYADS